MGRKGKEGKGAPPSPPREPGAARPGEGIAPFLLLAALVAAVYLRTAWNGFIPLFDDDPYLTANPVVRKGLTAEGVRWAFTTFAVSNWHPLTWISHMADVSLFGIGRPGAHHLVSAALHGANVLLFFSFLRRWTAAAGPSLFAAALFAVHPLHVESVAWLAERKDLLCALFFLLALHAHGRYARGPSLPRYLAVTGCFALALLSKPMAVTLPFVLLLLDAWPLGRTVLAPPADGSAHGPLPWGRLLLEKAPLLLLSAASSAVTLTAQSTALVPGEYLPAGQRVSVALVAFASYLGKLLWPAGLAMYYPLPPPPGVPLLHAAAAALLLALLTVLALRETRRRPFLPVGWLWFLGTMVPVIGVVKVGAQLMADRYAYLPFLGLYAALAWGIPGALARLPRREKVLPAAACAAVLLLGGTAFRQAGYWKDTETLFLHAIGATGFNYQIRNQLGAWYQLGGREEEALAQYEGAARVNPEHYPARLNAGEILLRRGDAARALPHLVAAARLAPGDGRPALDAGEACEALGRKEEAKGWFERALSLDPSDTDARAGLSRVTGGTGR